MKVCQTHFGHLNIEYCDYHSHSIRIGHLSLPEQVCLTVASKLKEGVANDSILDHIRDQVSDFLRCEHLISRQDLHNIKRQYTKMTKQVFVHRLKNCSHLIRDGKEGSLGKDDFILVIQTKFQCDMFGPASLLME